MGENNTDWIQNSMAGTTVNLTQREWVGTINEICFFLFAMIRQGLSSLTAMEYLNLTKAIPS